MKHDFEDLVQQFESYLVSYLEDQYASEPLGPVLSYAMSGRGKRVRPLFCMLSAKALGGTCKNALAPALAVEMIHTYSLVHDDLPCMDNDDLRRGRPTTHRKFGEGWALLAGDGLLTDAFDLLSSRCHEEIGAAQRLAMVRELAHASGTRGMVAGQAQDIYWTGRDGATIEGLDHIHRLKTGALLGAACALGALSAGADESQTSRLRKFGQAIGLAFQIRDDLIDQSTGTGKTAGKDLEAGKLTYLALMSAEAAEQAAGAYTHEAIELVSGLGENGSQLVAFANALLKRSM